MSKTFSLIILLGVAILAFTLFDGDEKLLSLLNWISTLGAWGPLVYIGVYILLTVAFIPGSIPTLASGVLFGVGLGTVYVSIASTLGATLAFLLGRYAARNWVKAKAGQYPKFAAVDHAVGREGWKIVFLTRLSPLFPFNFLNYAYGITDVRLKHFFLASWVGMLPGTLMYVYIGSLLGDLATLGATERARTVSEWALYGIGLAATVAVTVYVTKIARKALKNVVPA